MAKWHRQDRLGNEIKKVLSDVISTGIKDPILTERMLTITEVRVSEDRSYAICFISPFILNGEDRALVNKDVLSAFKRANGMLRTKISKEIRLRHAPKLDFRIDESEEYGRHIDELIEGIHKEEK